MNKIYLPELGEDIEMATLACWHKSAGDNVVVDDDICEVVTDKATFNVSCGHDGVLKELCFKAGDEIKIGEVLAIIASQKKGDHESF